MESSSIILEEAKDFSLLTLYEAKLALGMTQSDTGSDDQLEMLIRQASDEIAVMCNRVFAKEKLTEIFIGADGSRLFPSHYPVVSIDSIEDDNGVCTTDDYFLDKRSGKLTRRGGLLWSGDVTLTYTGGYDLPFEAPPALQQATQLLVKELYYSAVRGDPTIRMVSHKESRIMFYDPNASQRSASGGGGQPGSGSVGSAARRAANDLLRHYTRFYV